MAKRSTSRRSGKRAGKRPAKQASRPAAKRAARPNRPDPAIWVAASLPGLEDLLRLELERRFREQVSHLVHSRTGECHFRFSGRVSSLLSLRLCHTLYQRRDFSVVRPRTLLSPEHLIRLTGDVSSVMAIRPADRYVGLRLDAAGANSPTMQRLGTQLGEKLGLPLNNDDGDLVVSLRPGKAGWEVLYRVGNRPLGTRPWRQVDYRGSLSGTVAAALVELSSPTPEDRFLNLMCGSGVIMIERLKRCAVGAMIGVDRSRAALSAAQQNSAAAGVNAQQLLVEGDTRRLPFADGSFDRLCADLPWGESVGTRRSNVSLYRDTFAESHRLCRPGGNLVVLTQDVSALEGLADDVARGWDLRAERAFQQRGFQPRCRVYRKRD